MEIRNKGNFDKLIKRYLIITAGSFLLFFLLQFCFKGKSIFFISFINKEYPFYENGKIALFSDFAEVLRFVLSPNPYSTTSGASYPPLIFILLYPIGLICKNVIELPVNEIVCTLQFVISYVTYLIIVIGLSVVALARMCKTCRKRTLYILGIFVFSGPLIFAIGRGNVITVALLFTLFFLNGYNSEKKIVRELAYVCLAVAGAIKIYPLLFGILLLKKNLKASLRVMIYFTLLLLLPFLAFEGGISNFKLFISHMQSFVSDRVSNNGTNISLFGIFNNLFYNMQQYFGITYPKWLFGFFRIFPWVFFIFALYIAFFIKEQKNLLMIITCLICLVPQISFFYVSIFFIIPYISYCTDNYDKELQTKDKWIFAFFLYLFSPLTMVTYIMATIHCILIIAVNVAIICELLKSQKKKRILIED